MRLWPKTFKIVLHGTAATVAAVVLPIAFLSIIATSFTVAGWVSKSVGFWLEDRVCYSRHATRAMPN